MPVKMSTNVLLVCKHFHVPKDIAKEIYEWVQGDFNTHRRKTEAMRYLITYLLGIKTQYDSGDHMPAYNIFTSSFIRHLEQLQETMVMMNDLIRKVRFYLHGDFYKAFDTTLNVSKWYSLHTCHAYKKDCPFCINQKEPWWSTYCFGGIRIRRWSF